MLISFSSRSSNWLADSSMSVLDWPRTGCGKQRVDGGVRGRALYCDLDSRHSLAVHHCIIISYFKFAIKKIVNLPFSISKVFLLGSDNLRES